MRITVDENGYVTGWSIVGEEYGAICNTPDNFEHFMEYYGAYRYTDGDLFVDDAKLSEIELKHKRNQIRLDRQELCFPYINRGTLWYDGLSQGEKEELKQWYHEWLDAPETMTIPEQPEWLK